LLNKLQSIPPAKCSILSAENEFFLNGTAQYLAYRGKKAEVVYLDFSKASMKVKHVTVIVTRDYKGETRDCEVRYVIMKVTHTI
jgi:hypothetical protein